MENYKMIKSYNRILNEGFSNYIKKLEESANDTSITVYNVSGKPQIPLNFNNFKEIGLHCGTYETVKILLDGKYYFSEKPYFIYKIDLNLSHSMPIEDLNDWGSLEAVTALLNEFGYDEEEIEEVIESLRQKNADRKQYSSFCRKLCLENNVDVLEYVNEAEFSNENNKPMSYCVLSKNAINSIEEISFEQFQEEGKFLW